MNAETARDRLNILVVDDEAMIAMFLDDMLTDIGCNVVGPAGAVAPALALIETAGHTLDGALLDVNLRGDFAYPVADALLQRDVPFVFVTGYAAYGIDPRYAKIPAVTKPFQFATLENVIKTFAARRRAQQTYKPFHHDHAPRALQAAETLTSQQ